MNAEDAKKMAHENAKSEIDEIICHIKEAVACGNTQVILRRRSLLAGTLEWLKNNGYSLDYFNRQLIGGAPPRGNSEWDVAIKWR